MPLSTPEAQSAYQCAWVAARRAAWFAEHGPCVDCGTWDDLQLDHVDAKTKVSHRVWSWAAARRLAELAKCVARCAACHARKTTACGEHARGRRVGSAKLSPGAVRVIRKRHAEGESGRKLAAEFGVGKTTVYSILENSNWNHI